MWPLATDWATVSSLATGAGTLVLAFATFAAVRSANRSGRLAEEALMEQRRPVLAPSRFDDPVQKIMFVERHWVRAEGGTGVAEHINARIYLAMSLRNVGAGIGVCQAWAVKGASPSASQQHLPESEFSAQTRDLYVPAGDLGMWQGAMRDPDEPAYLDVANAIDALEPITIELLYSDQVGEQRTITRFALVPYSNPDTEEVTWHVSVLRHWFLDRPGPRSEREIEARSEQILRRVEDREPRGRAAEKAVDSGQPRGVERLQANGEGLQRSDGAERPKADGTEPASAITRPSCE